VPLATALSKTSQLRVVVPIEEEEFKSGVLQIA
jgi:hypothetical protein